MTNFDRYDLESCLNCNPQEGFTEKDVTAILAVVEGERDGKDWHWIVKLNDERHAYIVGGCDYTGWD